MVVDCLGAAQPPFRPGTLLHLRMQLISHNLAKTLLGRTVALAEKTGASAPGNCALPWTPTPLCGASGVEAPLTRLGHALWTAVGVAARQLGTPAEALMDLCSRALPR